MEFICKSTGYIKEFISSHFKNSGNNSSESSSRISPPQQSLSRTGVIAIGRIQRPCIKRISAAMYTTEKSGTLVEEVSYRPAVLHDPVSKKFLSIKTFVV